MKITNNIFYSKSALHALGDVFAHHQEHLALFTVSGSVHLVGYFHSSISFSKDSIHKDPTSLQA
jgi:ssRNA-specific RNase YbeY (16S rRNA maturation enzyme)